MRRELQRQVLGRQRSLVLVAQTVNIVVNVLEYFSACVRGGSVMGMCVRVGALIVVFGPGVEYLLESIVAGLLPVPDIPVLVLQRHTIDIVFIYIINPVDAYPSLLIYSLLPLFKCQIKQLSSCAYILFIILLNTMNLPCLRIDPYTGALIPNCCKLTLQTKQSTIFLDQQQIKPTLPIGLQINDGKLYIYINPTIIVAVAANKLEYVCQALQKCKLAALKVPEKETQMIAEGHESQGGCLVHCGTFENVHDCFIVFRKGQTHTVQIRNSEDQVIVKCSVKEIGFDDQKQAIGTYQGVFYFWKLLSYLEFKESILQWLQNLQAQEQPLSNDPHRSTASQEKISKENSLAQQKNMMQQDNMMQQKIKYSVPLQNQMEEQKQQQPNQMFIQAQQPILDQSVEATRLAQKNVRPAENCIQKIKQEEDNQEVEQKYIPKTEQKPIINKQSNQSTTAKKEPMLDEAEQYNSSYKYINNGHELFEVDKIIPIRLNMDHTEGAVSWRNGLLMNQQDSEKQNIQQNYEMENEQHQQIKKNEGIGQQMAEQYGAGYSPILCCQHECNVIDVQKQGDKHVLKYHKFGEDADDECRIVTSFDIFVLEQRVGRLGFNQAWRINPTKLAYDVQTHSVYYNDPNMGYLYSCSVRQQCQFSYFTYQPVLDLARHRVQCILGLQKNSIFQFDTRAGKKYQVATYKSVNNLTKLANMFNQNFYATAAADGVVRTYDIRNHNKALNKFNMQPGITSLKISRDGSYIMCVYGDKAHIISCTDRLDQSVFLSRTRIADRKRAMKLIGGHENLSHMQFIKGSKQGNVMALDDQNNDLVVKNVDSPSILKRVPLGSVDNKIEYLNSYDNWIVYGAGGNYYRHLFA